MDDYSINSLTESKNEWCARLVSILSHNIIKGINSIYDEAVKLCIENEEENKYLMTFQNLLSRIPSWNPTTIEIERKRIETVSGCKYLEDLISCVHLIQLKALTCIRVGLKQKKIDIDIPSIDKFIHNIYINTARKLYTSIYLFEKDIYPLQIQKNNRELELLVKEAILTTIRDNIPVEQILRVYMEETEEQEVNVEQVKENKENKEEKDKEKEKNDALQAIIDVSNNAITTQDKLDALAKNLSDNTTTASATDINAKIKTEDETTDKNNKEDNKANLSIDFSDVDSVISTDGTHKHVDAPKDLDTLEQIAAVNNEKRALEDAEDENEDNIKLNIGDDVQIHMDTINLNTPLELEQDPLLDDIEVL